MSSSSLSSSCQRYLMSKNMEDSPPKSVLLAFSPSEDVSRLGPSSCAFCGQGSSSSSSFSRILPDQEDWLRSLFDHQLDDEEEEEELMMTFCPSCHDSLTRLLTLKEEMDDLVVRMKAVLKLSCGHNKKTKTPLSAAVVPEAEEDDDDDLHHNTFLMMENNGICDDDEEEDDYEIEIKPDFDLIPEHEEEEGGGNDPLNLSDNPPDDEMEEDVDDEDEEWDPTDPRHVTTFPEATSKFFCLTCGRSYKDSWHLRKHLEGRGGRGHFPNPDLIKMRKEKEEGKKSKYFCVTCGKTFKDLWHLERHTKNKRHTPNPYIKVKRLLHRKKKSGRGGKVFVANEENSNPSIPSVAMTGVGEGKEETFPSAFLEVGMSDENVNNEEEEDEMNMTLRTRARRIRKDDPTTTTMKTDKERTTRFFCVTCGKSYKDSWYLRRHTQDNGHIPNPDLLKKMKEKGVPKRRSSEKKKKTDRNKYFCVTCGKCFKDSWYLRRHTQGNGHSPNPALMVLKAKGGEEEKLKANISAPPPSLTLAEGTEDVSVTLPRTKFFCVTCGKSYKDSWYLGRHTASNPGHFPNPDLVVKKRIQKGSTTDDKTPTQLDPSQIAILASQTRFFCSTCGDTFRDSWHLERHTQRLGHTPNPNLVTQRRDADVEVWKSCSICNARFRSDLLHQAHTHPDPSDPSLVTYLCPTCGKGLKDRKEFRNHLKFVHERLSASQCDLCGKVFSKRASMLEHVRVYHTPFEDQVTCPTCRTVFTSLRERVDHEKVVHRGLLSSKCYFCPYIPRDLGGLERHLRRHTLERPWICGGCGKETSAPYVFKAHLAKCMAGKRKQVLEEEGGVESEILSNSNLVVDQNSLFQNL